MILMDGNLDKIQATVGNIDVDGMSKSLQEKGVYLITNFTVIPNSGMTRLPKHRFQIVFHQNTSVLCCPGAKFADNGFTLSSIDEILQRRLDHDYLVDFIGIICGFKQLPPMEINGHAYPIVILNLYANGKKIQCNIVGNLAEVVDQDALTINQHPPVMLLQYFKVKVDQDQVILQNVVHVSRIFINADFKETVDFLNNYDIGRHYYPRLRQTDTRSLISQVDDPAFDWKLLRTILNLKSTNEDGVFFLVGKIMEVVDDPEWWYFSCVCGHPITGDDNVFRCQACFVDVEHFTVNYRVKVLIEDGTSLSLFVLLDAAVTKLIGKTCSDSFLVPDAKTQFAYCSPLFKDLLGLEKIFKVQRRKINSPSYRETLKIVDVFGDACSFPGCSGGTTQNIIYHMRGLTITRI